MTGVMMNDRQFSGYCWSFYGPNEMYGHFFGNTLTRNELDAAITLLKASDGRGRNEFAADSVDREHVRDLILLARGKLFEAAGNEPFTVVLTGAAR